MRGVTQYDANRYILLLMQMGRITKHDRMVSINYETKEIVLYSTITRRERIVSFKDLKPSEKETNIGRSNNQYLTIDELCYFLNINRSTYYRYMKDKENSPFKTLPSPVQLLCKKLYIKSEIEEWVNTLKK